MKQLLFIFFGGGIGSIIRFLISKTLNPLFQNFYLGTFLVNVLGCLLLGFLIGLPVNTNYLTQNQLLLLTAGFCGGFTTFSSFALENHTLLKSGDLFHFVLYTFLSILTGILSIGLGLWLSKLL